MLTQLIRRSEERRRTRVPSPSVVAYPGPPGSHTAAAAAALFPSAEPRVSFRAVAEAVTAGEAGYGVLPIESSLAGAVAETHDLLYEHELSIVAEIVQPIRHAIVGVGTLADVRVVRSHPTAFEQCREALGELALIPAATTADAVSLCEVELSTLDTRTLGGPSRNLSKFFKMVGYIVLL